jgi:hypothetical protein
MKSTRQQQQLMLAVGSSFRLRGARSKHTEQEKTQGSEEETRDCNALKDLKARELVPSFSPSSLKITVGLERQQVIRPDFGGGRRRRTRRRLEDGREQELDALRSSAVWPSIYSRPGPARRSIGSSSNRRVGVCSCGRGSSTSTRERARVNASMVGVRHVSSSVSCRTRGCVRGTRLQSVMMGMN